MAHSLTTQLEQLLLDNNKLDYLVLEVELLLLLSLNYPTTIPHLFSITPSSQIFLLFLEELFPLTPTQPLSGSLRHLSLLGNRLRCDCKVSTTLDIEKALVDLHILRIRLEQPGYPHFPQALWLRRLLESTEVRRCTSQPACPSCCLIIVYDQNVQVSVLLPPCFTPFSRNTLQLASLEGRQSPTVFTCCKCLGY